MATEQTSFFTTPCSALRGIFWTDGSSDTQSTRIGTANAPAPANGVGPWGILPGSPTEMFNNTTFFQKLLDAAMRLTGLPDTKYLSNVSIPSIFFQWGEGWTPVIESAFPVGFLGQGRGGKPLLAPFFESITPTFGATPASGTTQDFVVENIIFEDTAQASEPRYADFGVTVDGTNENNLFLTIKLFHSLTT